MTFLQIMSEDIQKRVRLSMNFYGSLQVNSGREFFLKGGDPAAGSPTATLLRLRPSRLSYRGRQAPSRVTSTPSGRTNSHGVTGGVYKTRERIHRGMLIRDY